MPNCEITTTIGDVEVRNDKIRSYDLWYIDVYCDQLKLLPGKATNLDLAFQRITGRQICAKHVSLDSESKNSSCKTWIHHVCMGRTRKGNSSALIDELIPYGHGDTIISNQDCPCDLHQSARFRRLLVAKQVDARIHL